MIFSTQLLKYNKDYRSIYSLLLLVGIFFVLSSHISLAQTDETVFSDSEIEVSEELKNTDLGYKTEFIPSPDDKIFGDFVVGPGKTELTIKPGESRKMELMVTNRMGDERIFKFETEDTVGTADPGQTVKLLGDERGPYTLKDYIIYPVESFVLKHNERARIPVTVTVPVDAEPGGLYGSLIVTTASKSAESNVTSEAVPQSAVVTRIGTLFFVTVPGDIEIGGALKSFTTLPNKNFFTSGPINFQLLFENTGLLHLSPYGEMRITNMLNEEVGFVELDPWFTMPNSLRSREVQWTREFLIGRYTAVVQINRGYDDIIDTQELVFWVLPWEILASVFVGLFIFFFAIRLFFKTFEFKRK